MKRLRLPAVRGTVLKHGFLRRPPPEECSHLMCFDLALALMDTLLIPYLFR